MRRPPLQVVRFFLIIPTACESRIISLQGEKANAADPICTFIFSILVLITTFTVIRDSFFILMEGRFGYDFCRYYTISSGQVAISMISGGGKSSV